ncbi:MAG: glycosyltransferase family 4 protein [Anaerolineae bacterium]|nr:glycosyltransferase family 4 protein [Anaerolineae bacterium]
MRVPRIAILHYTAPPVVGGVEAVILAHAQAFVQAGYPVTVLVGRGEAEAMPEGVDLVLVPEIDSQHAEIARMSAQLEQGQVPPEFEATSERLGERLAPILNCCDTLIVHNVFTKHFNLPLTAALDCLLDRDKPPYCIAWCHDFTWTSPSSSSKVHPGHPWDLLRSRRQDVTYVVVSQRRQLELAGLFGCPAEEILVIYNGVDPQVLLGLSPEGAALVERLGLLEQDLVLLMPVRVTQAKNIEYALRVVAALKARDCRPRLVLTGPPDPHDAESMVYFRTLQVLRQELGGEKEMRFVFELGSVPDEPYLIDAGVVGDLFRVSDLMFMPSHREGFAMPVLEAGLAGIPVVCTEVPAAVEIGGEDVILFGLDEAPDRLAERILAWADGSVVHRLRRRVRQNFTWQAIFRRDIEPLLRRREDV